MGFQGSPSNPDVAPDHDWLIAGWGEHGPPRDTREWAVPLTPPDAQVWQPGVGYCFGPRSLLGPERPALVEVRGRHYHEPKTYRSITHAFCANKCANKHTHDEIARLPEPRQAWGESQLADRWEDWAEAKFKLMEVLLASRLERDNAFRMALIASVGAPLSLDLREPIVWTKRDRDGDFLGPNAYGKLLANLRSRLQ